MASLDESMRATGRAATDHADRLFSSRFDAFREAQDDAAALHALFGGEAPADRQAIVNELVVLGAAIDELISEQLNAVLHHPRFQSLEASWRGVQYLVRQKPDDASIKIRILDVSWRELTRDIERAVEFDQSQVFRKVYTDQFDLPGGEPFGLLIGDYEVRHRPSADYPFDDVATMTSLASVGAAAFTPIVLGAAPSFLGLDSFRGLRRPLDLQRTFAQTEYDRWRRLRKLPDARFLGLTMPRVLMREPYTAEYPFSGVVYQEEADADDGLERLWGTAAYCLAAVVMRAYASSGWFAEIRGSGQGMTGGGVAPAPISEEWGLDRPGACVKPSLEAVIPDQQDTDFAAQGFIAACPVRWFDRIVFTSVPSVQEPEKYDSEAATTNARLSSMLHYMLCVSRFAHYVKIIVRDKVGAFADADDCQAFLHRWLLQYVTGGGDLSEEVMARYPLNDASVRVSEAPGEPGAYRATVHLNPHFQLDELSASLKLTTQLPGSFN